MNPRQQAAPSTVEDLEIWVYWALRRYPSRKLLSRVHIGYMLAERRDADLMFEQSNQLPGFACIRVYYDDVVIQHNIAGRLAREEFERIRDPNWPRNGKPLV